MKTSKFISRRFEINWMRYIWLYFILSAMVIIPGVFSLLKWGLKPSIDFTGGSLLEIRGEEVDGQVIEKTAEELGLELRSQQRSGERTFLIRFGLLGDEEKDRFLERLGGAEVIRWQSLGPALGKELLIKTGIGIVLAILGILIFLNSQFKKKRFGVCAILAMLHDTLILLGSISLLGHFLGVEADALFVTAVLTILSFSVHDTVVVYDRIRELSRISPKEDLETIANMAVSQTLARSVNNSLTIIFMLAALVALGGATTRWFAAVLLIGTIAGTYSSTFTAVPLLVLWQRIFERKKQRE